MKRKKSIPQVFTYKQPNTLRNFLTEQGTIIPRSLSGLALKKQRELAKAIKHARHLALLPFTQTI